MTGSKQQNFHDLKSLSENFLSVHSGVQIRKNDRNYQENDRIFLREIGEDGQYTGRSQAGVITHVIDKFEGLQDGYVVLKVRPVELMIYGGNKYVTKTE